MLKPVAVKALTRYKIWLRYEDGAEGDVDLSDLAGKGVFKIWDEGQSFEQVEIDEHGAIAWPESIDLCPDMLYMRLTGKSPEEIFPNLNRVQIDA